MGLTPDGHGSEAYGSQHGVYGSYEPSVTSSASSSQFSIFSDNASQHSSIASSVSDDFRLSQEDARERDRVCAQAQLRFQARTCQSTEEPSAIGKLIKDNYINTYSDSALTYADVTSSAVQHRPNPRRTVSVKGQRPPSLVRQRDRKVNFVDNLVDSAAQMVEVIWPLSVVPCSSAGKGVLPLRTYIEETLRRSRTSYSTLQVALYYIVLIKPFVPKNDFTMEQEVECLGTRALMCGRRMFLAALILASKYLQDRNYSAKAWSKMSGLKVNEINANERVFLEKIDWKLHIPKPTFELWQEVVLRFTPQPPSSPGLPICTANMSWRNVVPLLSPSLDSLLVAHGQPKSAPQWDMLTPGSKSATPTPRQAPLCAINMDTAPSQESTPTPTTVLPHFLEPRPELAPPTPLLARMGPLPTPQMTPSSVASSTPAVSACNSRRPSMCSAMAMAHKAGINRCVLDACSISNDSRYTPSRRPSIMSSSSGPSSSPESLMSDLSRSSRASSVSSISTVSTNSSLALQRTSLARLATCRNVRLPLPSLVKEENEDGSELKPIFIDDDVEMVSSPDMADFSVSTRALHAPHRHSKHAPAIVPVACAAKSADKGRKRCRSSGHHRRSELQEEVRFLLQESLDEDADAMDVDEGSVSPTPAAYHATSMLAVAARPGLTHRDSRLSLASHDGKKRTCLTSTADPAFVFHEVRAR